MNFNITNLLNQIHEVHSNMPLPDKLPVHIEIFSTDNSVGLHQFVGKRKNLTLTRYIGELNSIFDLELSALLSNYLAMITKR